MIRRVIKIDEDKCIGCELCVNACHEGAIGMVNGRRSFCGMITATAWVTAFRFAPQEPSPFEEREAAEYNEAAVQETS